jgi:hypothetical protein
VGESNSQAVDSKSTRYASSRQRRKVDLEGFEPSTVSGPLSAFTDLIPIKPISLRKGRIRARCDGWLDLTQ